MENGTRTASHLREGVAEEVRALLARKRLAGAKLALAIGKSEMYVSRRLRGETAFDLDDLERIADVLGVAVADLLPQSARVSGQPVITPKPNLTERPSMRPTATTRPKNRQPDGGPGRRTARVPRTDQA